MLAGKIKLVYCASEDMIADMLTKELSITQFDKLRRLAGVSELGWRKWGVLVKMCTLRLLLNLEHSYSLLCNQHCAFVYHKHYTCISVSLEE